jgi:hypothetical protein
MADRGNGACAADCNIIAAGRQRMTRVCSASAPPRKPVNKIAAGTIAFQSHDTYSVTAYSNIRIKLLN